MGGGVVNVVGGWLADALRAGSEGWRVPADGAEPTVVDAAADAAVATGQGAGLGVAKERGGGGSWLTG